MADDRSYSVPCYCGGWVYFEDDVEQPHEHHQMASHSFTAEQLAAHDERVLLEAADALKEAAKSSNHGQRLGDFQCWRFLKDYATRRKETNQ